LSPFGPTEEMRLHETWSLNGLGRFDEARAAELRITGKWKIWVLLATELGAGNYAVAESVATAHVDDPEMTREWPAGYRMFLSNAQAGRGAVRAAAATLDQSVAIGNAADPGFQFSDQVRQGVLQDLLALAELSDFNRGVTPLPPEAWLPDTSGAALATSTGTLLTRGFRAALGGDRRGAERMLDMVRMRSEPGLMVNGAVRGLLAARIETLAGRPEEAVRLLRPIAARRTDPEYVMPGALAWVRWTLADAFEQVGRPDSAAVCLRRIPGDFLTNLGWEAPYAHQRLAMLNARAGRIADAERDLAAVEKAWDRPDPEIRRLLEEARTAVRAARGVARPERARR
jgi:hypothetical protein